MLNHQKIKIGELLAQAVQVVTGETLTVALETPKDAALGDVACTIALQLAKPLKKNPRELAAQIIETMLKNHARVGLIDSAEVAGPGFINLRLHSAAKQAVVREILQQGTHFGVVAVQEMRAEAAESVSPKVLVEFVSANPTGPLHVGHARQAALGDALANLLGTQGLSVSREFYYNDAGMQIHNLALSVQARAQGVAGDDAAFPPDGYRGEYIADIAQQFLNQHTIPSDDGSSVKANGDAHDLDNIRRFAVAYLRREQDADLQAFGVKFDVYYLESSLYAEGKVEATVNRLKAQGKTFEQDGALWLRSTEYGDDKDRVMKKSNTMDAAGNALEGGYTYFVPDVAYHITKWQRGFGQAINVQGTDHHGTMARVRAGLQAVQMGIAQGFPDYVLHSMVKVMRGGVEVKMSKRTGNSVTLRDLLEWVGRDAVRFFLVSRKADSEFVFDLDLALSKSEDNPVFYVQYAHARICSVLAQAGLNQLEPNAWAHADLSPLIAAKEFALMQKLAVYPAMLKTAARELAPHQLPYYLRELAADFHAFYNSERVLVDDVATKQARLALLCATRQVLQNGLALLGVSAPEKM